MSVLFMRSALLTRAEAAARLRLGERSVDRMCRAGLLEIVHIGVAGRAVRITVESIEEHIAAGSTRKRRRAKAEPVLMIPALVGARRAAVTARTASPRVG